MKLDVNGTNLCFHILLNTANSTSSWELIFFTRREAFSLERHQTNRDNSYNFLICIISPGSLRDSSQWYVNLRWLYITCGACETFYYATSVPAELYFTYKRSAFRSFLLFFFSFSEKRRCGKFACPFYPIENVKIQCVRVPIPLTKSVKCNTTDIDNDGFDTCVTNKTRVVLCAGLY